MRRRLVVVIGVLTALVTLLGYGSGSVLAPAQLQAQTCGAHTGPLCAADCGRECSTGGCCGWLFYYYRAPNEQ
jgi:hypothetical protein